VEVKERWSRVSRHGLVEKVARNRVNESVFIVVWPVSRQEEPDPGGIYEEHKREGDGREGNGGWFSGECVCAGITYQG
jgi:hypothetical protein